MKSKRLFGLSCAGLLGMAAGCAPEAADRPGRSAYSWLTADHATRSLSEIADEVERTYADLDRGRGSGYKHYRYWKAFVTPRTHPDRRVTNFAARTWQGHQALVESGHYTALREAAASNGDWRFVGPTSVALDGNSQPGGVGRVSAVAFHPTEAATLFAASPSGGLWKSTDDGATWSPLTDDLPWVGITDIAIDRQNPANIYLMTGDANRGDTPSIGVLKSIDGGETWQPTGLRWGVDEPYLGYRLTVDPRDGQTLLAATTIGLLKTDDGGKLWRTVLAGSFRDVAVHPTDPSRAYAGDTSAVYRSDDAGETWTPTPIKLPSGSGVNRATLAVTPARPDRVYVLFSGHGFNPFVGLYRSDDGGLSFDLQSSDSPNILGYGLDGGISSAYMVTMAASPLDPDVVNVGSVNTWRSEDGGKSWSITSYWQRDRASYPPYVHADVNRLAYRGGTLYVASDGGLSRSSDGGSTWTDITSGLGITQLYQVCGTPQEPGLLLLGAQDNGLSRLPPGATRMTPISGGDTFYCQIDPANSDSLYFELGGTLFRSDDGGKTMTDINPVTNDVIGAHPVAALPENFQTVYYCRVDLWRSVDGGKDWHNLTRGLTGKPACAALAIGTTVESVLYVAKPGALYRSPDSGASWEDRTGTLPVDRATISDIVVDPDDPDRFWVSLSGYTAGEKVLASDDGGVTYRNLTGGLPNLPVNVLAIQPGGRAVYAGLDVGIYYRDDTVGDWTPFFDSLPLVIVRDLVVDRGQGTIQAATFGRGVWESPLYPLAAAQ